MQIALASLLMKHRFAMVKSKVAELELATIIKEKCQALEKQHDITILFAIENGSRAWRMESADSDFDVRFVFKRQLKEYVQIHQPSDVIQAAFDKAGNPTKTEGALIDISGFDIFKFTKMLSVSNPTCIEWLVSDIVYYGEQNKAFQLFAKEQFSPLALYHHYKSMCRNNYLKYLKSKALVTYKKYLYAYRGLVNAKWVAHHKTLPPIIFPDALAGMEGIIPEKVLINLKQIIHKKSSGNEKEILENILELDSYLESFLDDNSDEPYKGHATLNKLNDELRKILL